MNGSRSNSPRPGAQPHGDRSSLDALNRTIEGLEARIEGLMGTAARDPRSRADTAPARHDPIAEIMQRQRTLSATRERDILRDRGPQTRGYDDRREAQSPISSERDVPVSPQFGEGLRSEQFRREPLRSEPRRSERQDTPRPEFPRREPMRSEPQRPDPATAEIAQALVGLRQELKRTSPTGFRAK